MNATTTEDRTFLERLRSWLDAISGISREVNRGAPLDELLELIAGTTCDLAGYDFSAVLLPDEEETCLLIRGSCGLGEKYVRQVNARRPIYIGATDIGEAPSSRAYRYHRPVALRDIWADSTCAPWETVAHDQGNRSLLSLPLLTSRGAVGVLNCYMRRTREFSAEDIVFMETIANQAALAIESATLRSTERATIERLESLNDQLRRQQAFLRRTEHAHRMLLRVVLANQEIDDLVTVTAEVLGSPVVLEDRDGTMLASSAGFPMNILPRCRDRVDRRFAELQQAVGSDADAVAAVSYHGEEPVADVDEQGHRVLAAPVHLDGELIARVWAADAMPADSPYDFEHRVLESAAIVTALVMSKHRVAREAQWRVSRELVDELLWRGDRIDVEAATARGRQVGIDLAQPHVLMVVRDSWEGQGGDDGELDVGSRSLLSRLEAALQEHGSGAAVPGRGREVILLCPLSDELDAAALARSLLRRGTGSRVDVNLALSPECEELSDYPAAYESAKQALCLAEARGVAGRVLDVRKLGVYRVLLNASRPHELARFSREQLGSIVDYDADRDGDLLETLRAFFEKGCSANEAADVLYVHSNTVRYRLRRIEEILDVKLDHESDRLELHLALIIHDLLEGENGRATLSVGALRRADRTSDELPGALVEAVE